jgi:endogenous inhibitor of DNA gyrase (YacG/DUF329 family)
MLQKPHCAYCGKVLPLSKPIGRRRRFCSTRCRVAEFRYALDDSVYKGPGRNDFKSENATIPDTCKPDFRGRGIDLRGIDQKTRGRIIDLEFAGWRWAHPHEDNGDG